MASLLDKVVIITGASSGIGAATALEFANYGSKLVMVARTLENLNKVADKCKAKGLPSDKILVVPCDITKEENMRTLVDTAVQKFGKIDVLVNNAGSGMYNNFMDTKMEDFDRVIAINVRAPFYLTQLCVPHLVKTTGCVVNVSSNLGQRTLPFMISYCMSKAALDHFTRTLAVDLSTQKVRVNSVNPGMTVTNFQRAAGMDEERYQKYLTRQHETQPLCGAVPAEEVAKAIKFFASDEAACITGETLFVDGGRHCKSVS